MDNVMIIKCIIAANSINGPDLFFCKVQGTEEQIDNEDHYDVAKGEAQNHGFEHPMIVFDQYDPPKCLFDLFAWETASVIKIKSESKIPRKDQDNPFGYDEQ